MTIIVHRSVKVITIESKAHAGYQRSINEQLNRQTSLISKHVNSMSTTFDSHTKRPFCCSISNHSPTSITICAYNKHLSWLQNGISLVFVTPLLVEQ